MSRWASCKRRDFIRRLQKLGFDGPFSGTRHQFMVYEQHRRAIPSNAEYSVPPTSDDDPRSRRDSGVQN